MFKRIPVYFVVLISILAFCLIASGCSKKQVIKEEAAGKPVIEAKKERAEPNVPTVMEKPKEKATEASPAVPGGKPKEEVKQGQKTVLIDLASLRIQFAFDDYSLSPNARKNLDQIASWLSKTPDAKIQIQGNTCDIGTAEYNLTLGDRRASSAKMYLERLGIDSKRISTISYGEERPMAPNTDESSRSKNRRDDFSRGN
jgi:peptidoglycan-associated lipoprotein